MVWYKDEVQRLFNLKTFPKLEKAIDYLTVTNSKRASNGRLPKSLFAREIAASGCRYFFIEHPSDFYDYYMTLEKDFKSFYEVLLSG